MPDGEVIEREATPIWKTPHNHDTEFESARTALFTPEPSLTKQEFKEDADINVILERFLKTGQVPAMVLPEHFADNTTRKTYFEAATAAAEANDLFYRLPPALRGEHLNDPTRWADAVVTAVQTNDRDALAKLGIAVPEKPQEPNPGTPPPLRTPAAAAAQAAPEGSKGGNAPKPQSDNGK